MTDEERIDEIESVIKGAVNSFLRRFPETTTGNVMDALFNIFVESARASPHHDPEKFIAMITQRAREEA